MTQDTVHPQNSDDLIEGISIEGYELLSLIGEGGMGLVYKARHRLMNRLVAIKIIRSELVDNDALMQRFRQEAQAVSKLHHQNIVVVYDYGVSPEGLPYLVMDYLDGISLSDLLTTEGRLQLDRAMPLFLQACRALLHAHDRGIIHRDVKASNFVICQSAEGAEQVKVVDFGMAKLMRPETEGQTVQELTQLGEVFGSPLYMSPEQCKGQKLDARSDIYSLACVMYYAVAGRPPFLGENVLDTLQRQINDEPPPPSQYHPNISAEFDAIVLKALRKLPEERYQDMGQLLMDVEAVTAGKKRVVSTHKLKSNRRRFLSHNFESNLIVLSLVACVVIGMTAFMSGRMFEAADESQEMNMWVDRNQDADKARTKGDLKAAEQLYLEASTEAGKFGRSDPRLAKSLVSLGATYAEDHQFLRAETTLKRAQQILEKCYGAECSEVGPVLVLLSEVYEEEGRQGEAKDLRQKAEQLEASGVVRHLKIKQSTVADSKALDRKKP